MHQRKVEMVVRGGTVVTSAGSYPADVAIDQGRFIAVGQPEALPEGEREVDATGKLLFPGFVDVHTHLSYDGWADLTLAAAHGGITTLIVFGGPTDPNVGFSAWIEDWRRKGEQESRLDFGLHMILSPRIGGLDGLPEAVRMGVTSFKLFMSYKTGPSYAPDDFVLKAMAHVQAVGGLVQLHAENAEINDFLENAAQSAGQIAPECYPPTHPAISESEGVNRGLALARVTGCPIYFVHVTTAESLPIVRHARLQGQPVWAETCPQYLLLNDEAMKQWGPYAKIGPPLRTPVDNAALWLGLSEGLIATVASDHMVGNPEVKDRGWQNIFRDQTGQSISSGAPSTETMIPLLYSEGVVRRGYPLSWLARVSSENPARLFGLYPRKGVIRPGSDADLTILDPSRTVTLRGEKMHGRAGFTLYEGWEVTGCPWMTLARGRVVLESGQVRAEAGTGRYLPRGVPTAPRI